MINLPGLKPPKRKHQIEDSVPLRVVTSAVALTGLAASAAVTEAPLWLVSFSMGCCIVGSYISYRRRHSNNFVIKIWISVAILFFAFNFFQEIIMLANASVADARVPLTKLLMGLVGLHCFDLPRRRDLSVAALVGLTLITAAATLSRDLSFAAYAGIFALLSICMFQLDCISRSLTRACWLGNRALGSAAASPEQLSSGDNASNANVQNDCSASSPNVPSPSRAASLSFRDLKQIGIGSVLMLCITGAIFTFIPRTYFNFLNQWHFQFSMPYQFRFNRSEQASTGGDGSIKISPKAYYGFAEILDTNYRGELGDEIVLRVSGATGSYLRGMAYDNFDGKIWRMTRPKLTEKCVAGGFSSITINSKLHFFSRKIKYKMLTQVVYVEQDSSNLVVCANIPSTIYFPASELELDTYDGIRSPAGMLKDMVYTVSSRVPIYDEAILRALPEGLEVPPRATIAKFMPAYHQLPATLSPELAVLASKVAGKGNDWVRADRICRYLQRNYKYDLNIAATPAGLDSVSDFLFHKKRGYCEHFASAMVMMARSQGLAARLVTGYMPGQYNPFTGFWEVRLKDAHSWAEVFIPTIGWVPFDATPDSLMGSSSLQEQQSVLEYLWQRIQPLLQSIFESPLMKELAAHLQNLLLLSFDGLNLVWTNFKSIIIFAIFITVLASIKQLNLLRLPDFSRFFADKAKRAQRVPLEEASREFLNLSDSLRSLGIERRISETADDLLQRVQLHMTQQNLESSRFVSALSEFMDLYAAIRFGYGGSDELQRLKQEAIALDKLSREVLEQRKEEAISS